MQPLNILLVTPAGRGSRAGNRATADRWRRRLRELGHRVRVATAYDGRDADLLLAIHAFRSADAVRAFRREHPDRALIVLLAGTDIYRFQHSDPETTLATMDAADVLIGLHERVADDIPARFRDRVQVVLQSAEPMERRPPLKRHFEICVIGHLREEKDSLRAAQAVRDLPAESRLRITQLGRAHNNEWSEAARREKETNPRFDWRGERPRGEVRRLMARARAMVMSSRMEGGANAVSEACRAGLPVIASDIPGNIGLLGEDYPGYYPVADTAALRACLLRAETDPDWLETLRRHCLKRAELFTAEQERASLARAVTAALEARR